MVEEAIEKLKKHDFRSEFRVGDYIDAKDSVDKWCVAQITRLDSQAIGLHYEGWGPRYDVEFRRTSAKLQPFRRQVLGYTGQSKSTLRDFAVNDITVKEMPEKVNALLDGNFQGLGAHRITQFVRGELYFYMDTLLTHNQVRAEHLPFISDFFELFFKLIEKWTSLAPSLIPLIVETKKVPNLFLVHELTAIAMLYPELLDTISKLFCSTIRVERRYKDLASSVGKSGGQQMLDSLQTKFIKSNAFSGLLKLFNYKNDHGHLAIPFELAHSILSLTRQIASRRSGISFLDEVVTLMNKRIEQIDNSEIKELEKRRVKDVIDLLAAVRRTAMTKPADINRFRDQQELTLAAKFIHSPYLQKRIQGLNDLKQFSKRINSSKYADQGLDSKSFCVWLVQEKIIPHIFGESCHGQLVRRSGELLRLLSQLNRLPPEYVEILWNSTQGKHEDIVRLTYDVIVELVEWLDLAVIEAFFQRISSVPVASYDQTMVQFVYHYSKGVKRNIQIRNNKMFAPGLRAQSASPKIDSTKYYKPNIFWSILTEHSDPLVRQEATLYLNELLTTESQELRSLFFDFSVKNIAARKCFVASMEVLIGLIDKSQSKQKRAYLERLKKTPNDIMDLVLLNSRDYVQIARDQIRQLKLQASEVGSGIFDFSKKHQDIVKTVQQTLFQLSTMLAESQFNNEEVRAMWDIFIDHPLCPSDQVTFFRLFMKDIPQQKPVQRLSVLTQDNREYLLLEIFAKFYDFTKLTNEAFACIRWLFYQVNRHEKNIIFRNSSEWYQNNPFEYKGFEQVWRATTLSEDGRVFEQCCKYIVDILLCNRSEYDMKNNINEYLHRCCSSIRDSGASAKRLIRYVRMLRMLVIKVQGLILVAEPLVNPEYNVELTLGIRLEQSYKQMKITMNTQVHQIIHLRKRISDKLSGRGANDFVIYADRLNVSQKYDYHYFQNFENYRNWEVVLREPKFKSNQTPRFILANTTDYLQSLFYLLSLNDATVLNEAWELMSLLPPNIKIKDKLTELKLAKGSGYREWQDFLEMKNPRLLSYYLRLLEDMIFTKDDLQMVLRRLKKPVPNPTSQLDLLVKGYPAFEEKVRYTKNFINRGGLTFVKDSLTKGKWLTSADHDIIEVKCVTFMLRIMTTPLLHAFQFEKEAMAEIVQSIFRMMDVISVLDLGQDASLDEHAQVVKYSFLLLKELVASSNKHKIELIEQTGRAVQSIIIIMVLKHASDRIRSVSAEAFLELGQVLPDLTLPMVHKLLGAYEQALEAGPRSYTFFHLANQLMEMDELRTTDFLRSKDKMLNELWKRFSSEIIQRVIHESKSSEKDVALQGTLVLARRLLPAMQSVDNIQLLHSNLLTQRLFQHFSNSEYERQMQRLLFKNAETRQAGLQLLVELCSRQPDLAFQALKHLLPFHIQDSWRKWTNSDWNIICDHKEKSETGYVGMKNLGATCYMNSLLQQMFMIPAFRKLILEADPPTIANQQGKACIDDEGIIWQLKRVFGALSESDEQYYDPLHFVQSFKDIDGSAINPLEQRDVDEFFNMLVDRVETQLQGTPSLRDLSNIFGGKLSNELICLDCPHRSEREEPFLAMPLKVVSKKNLKESLDAYVEGDLLQGDNAFYCDKCDKKVTTLKRCSVKRLPNTLLLVLKRFDINFDTLEKYKVNDFLEFPTELNMKEYTQESLSSRDLLKKLGIAQQESKGAELTEDHLRVLQKSYPDDYYKYKLKGIVIHYGQSEHGHYYSFIAERGQEENWFQFDDKNVTYFNPKSIPTQAYGGVNQQTNRNMVHNAYMLFYERVTQVDTERLEQTMEDLMGQELLPGLDRFAAQKHIVDQLGMKMEQLALGDSGKVKMHPEIREIVREANHRFWLGENIFNPDYITFLRQLHETLANAPAEGGIDYNNARSIDLQKHDQPLKSFEITRFGLIVFLTTIVRYKHRRSPMFSFVKLLKSALVKDAAACVWLIETFTHPTIIREMLIECPNSEVTHHISGLLAVAMAQLYPQEKDPILLFANECYSKGQLKLDRAAQLLDCKISPPETSEEAAAASSLSPAGSDSSSSASPLHKRNNPEAQLSVHHGSPYLLAFINACLLEILPAQKKFDNSLLFFYKIFSDFCDLGPEARLYLLKCRVPRILLDVIHYADKALLYQPDSISNILKLKLADRPLTMGTGKTVQREKPFYRSIYGGDRSACYLLSTLSKLICSCVFKEHIEGKKESASLNVQPPCFKLSPDESDALGGRVAELRNKILAEASCRPACRAIGELFAHISYADRARTQDILNSLFSHVEREGENKIQRYFDILAIVIRVRDDMRMDRAGQILQQTFLLCKNAKSIFRFFLQLAQFILQLAKKEPLLIKESLQGIPELSSFYSTLKRFFDDNKNINFHSYRIYFFKKLNFEPSHFSDYLTNDFQRELTQYCRETFDRLKRLFGQQDVKFENTFDCDSSYNFAALKPGDPIDYQSYYDWVSAEVVENSGEMLKLQLVEDHSIVYAEVDSDLLAPAKSSTKSKQAEIDLNFNVLFTAILDYQAKIAAQSASRA